MRNSLAIASNLFCKSSFSSFALITSSPEDDPLADALVLVAYIFSFLFVVKLDRSFSLSLLLKQYVDCPFALFMYSTQPSGHTCLLIFAPVSAFGPNENTKKLFISGNANNRCCRCFDDLPTLIPLILTTVLFLLLVLL